MCVAVHYTFGFGNNNYHYKAQNVPAFINIQLQMYS